uniref:F-box domain-containing protein n=1 Tax=Tanacetum cinerariifolium TaxID=118510 RepID=A0A6L2NVU2_TANCI|nr:hypothetical protein [Tanacetum cinerariifolium]
MDRLPLNIILDIFSRVAVKYLARFRCVSKVWCKYIDDPYLVIIHDKRVVDEPMPIMYHPSIYHERICFHVIESKQPGTNHYVLEPKEGPVLEYSCKEPCYIYSKYDIKVHGSCNGLMCLSQGNDHVITSLAVVHPLRKECYELLSFLLLLDRLMRRKSCGLGFDTSTNTWKMVCVLLKEYAPPEPDMVKKNQCTMVHVFGTNSWREIPQVPSYPISEKEEFGLIDPPKRMCDKDSCRYQVVDLNGDVGYVYTVTMEFFLLNHKKEWVPHCQFKEEIIPNDLFIDVIGCWNKDGDTLIKSIGGNPLHSDVTFIMEEFAKLSRYICVTSIEYPRGLQTFRKEEIRRLEAMGTYTDDEINRLARGGKQRGHIAGMGRYYRHEPQPAQFKSGGASGSGRCGDEEEGADHQDDEDEDGDGDT